MSGVVRIVNTAAMTAIGEPPQPAVYFPLRQHFARRLTLYVKARGDAAVAAADVVAAITSIDPDLLRPERLASASSSWTIASRRARRNPTADRRHDHRAGAALIAAMRSARLEPMQALRVE